MSHPAQQTPDSASFDEKKVDGLDGGAPVTTTLTAGVDEPEHSEHDVAETNRIMSKIDWRVLPVCAVLYLFSFLDRSAIGNAKTAGMNKSLKLTDSEYAGALSAFFALYCLLEVPSNILLKKYGAKIYLPCIVVLWGIIMMCTAFVKNFEGLLAMRILLGGFEAGLFPGVTWYISTLYPRRAIQLRIGMFFSAATIAGAFGGLLAYGLVHIRNTSMEPWSYIFLVEGILTIVAGVVSYWVLFDGHKDAKFLTEAEKEHMQYTLAHDATATPFNTSFQWKFVRAGLTDWKVYWSLLTYISCITPLYSIALTLPSILRISLGYDPIKSQLLTVPVYIVAALLVVVFAWGADRFENRSAGMIAGTSLSLVGWAILLTSHTPNVRYGATFLAAAGSYAAFPSIVALVSQNVASTTKRGVAIAIQVGVGGLAGTISSNIFPARTAPRYELACKINVAMNAVAILTSALNVLFLYIANKKKQRMLDSGEAQRIPREVLADMGDASPYFKYKY